MKTDINGCSTCPKGRENFEYFTMSNGKEYIQYDYRHADGELFSTVAKTIEACRSQRDIWLNKK